MHIPENYLSPSTCAVMTAAVAPAWIHSVRKVHRTIPKEKLPLLGIGAAFSFLSMMLNIPLPGGTTGHAVGGTLIALLVGPEAACISVTIALLIQALLFGDGGILAFGANCFNMAFVLPFVGYSLYRLLRRHLRSDSLAAALGSYAGINAAALCASIEFGVQPYLFHNAAGQALYCPYGLNVSIPSMMLGHLTLFGLAEALFTVAVYAFIKKTSPGTLYEGKRENRKSIFALIAALIVIAPVGLLAQGTAWGEWGSDEIAGVVSGGSALGYTPSGLGNGWSLSSLFPDYAVTGIPDWIGYLLSAVIGVALIAIVFKLAANFKKGRTAV